METKHSFILQTSPLKAYMRILIKNTPIIFVLSPGVDPHTQLETFARSKGFELVPVSLGQGQAKKAKDKVN